MSAGITLAKALSVFNAEVGCQNNGDRENILEYITEAVEYLLLHGGGDILREWQIPLREGRFTLPRDLDTPVKYKFSETADYGFGTINSPYLSYSSTGIQSCCGFYDWDKHKIALSANKVVTQFYPPSHGVRLVATTRDHDSVGKKMMVGGKRNGMQLAPKHKGRKTSGELLTIYHEDDPDKNYGSWVFDEITHVVKDETCDYIMLSGIDVENTYYHLSHYHPDETVPQYTEGHLFNCHTCRSGGAWDYYAGRGGHGRCDYTISVLGRVNPSIRYVRDEDILPIQTHQMLRFLAKRARYYEHSDFNEVQFIETKIRELIKKLVSYQQAPNRQMSFNLAASGGSLTNM